MPEVAADDSATANGSPRQGFVIVRRKVVWIPLSVVGVICATAAIVWWAWLPQYRPGLKAGESYGVDVSNHQGEIDWYAVAGDDIDFAYIKATEGGDFVDDWFGTNWDGARAAGLDVGGYHFFTLCRPGGEQAANFLGTVPVAEADLPAALDLELAGNCSDRPTTELGARTGRGVARAGGAGDWRRSAALRGPRVRRQL